MTITYNQVGGVIQWNHQSDCGGYEIWLAPQSDPNNYSKFFETTDENVVQCQCDASVPGPGLYYSKGTVKSGGGFGSPISINIQPN